MYKTSEFKDFSKTNPSRLAQMIENPYKVFAASKMSNGKKTMCVVEYTDLMGTKHRIQCSNRTQMKNAQTFLSIFKQEAANVKSIISEYPISFGRVPKRFMKELRNDLAHYGFSSKFVNQLAGY